MRYEEESDRELLRRYVESGSAEAYRQLVDRHAGMVYATARRILGNHHETEDATQTVFLLLVKKARSLSDGVVVAGWLHRAAWFIAKAVQAERTRRTAAEVPGGQTMPEDKPGAAVEWSEIRLHIDEAMGRLPLKSRSAVILHYFEGRTLREVGEALGCSEDAARKRIAWSLERMRPLLCRRGVALTGIALAACLGGSASAAQAPAALVQSVVELGGGSTPAAKLFLIREAVKLMRRSAMRTIAPYAAAAVVLLAAVGTGMATAGAQPGPVPNPTPRPLAGPAAKEQARATEGWIRGVVTDDQGRPLPGAVVYAFRGSSSAAQTIVRGSAERWETFGADPLPPIEDRCRFPMNREPAITDANGVFKIGPISLPLGEFSYVAAAHRDFGRASVSVKLGLQNDQGEVRIPSLALPKGNSLSGQVFYADGTIAPCATVAVQPQFKPWTVYYRFGDVRLVRADETGSFTIRGMRKGSFSLTAWTSECPPTVDCKPIEQVVHLGNAPEVTGLACRIERRNGVTMTVRTVVLPDKRPLPGCYVWIDAQPRWQPVDAVGVCVIRGLIARKHEVIVAPPDNSPADMPGYRSARFSIEKRIAPGEVTFELYPHFDVAVKAIDEHTGKPVDGLRACARVVSEVFDTTHGKPSALLPGDGKPNVLLRKDDDGAYRLEGLRPGPWHFEVFVDGYLPASRRIDIPMAGLTGPVAFSLTPATGTLKGKLVWGGVPIAGAQVTCTDKIDINDMRVRTNTVSTRSGVDGSFELRNVWGGSYPAMVKIEKEGYVGHEFNMYRIPSEDTGPRKRLPGPYGRKVVHLVHVAEGAPRPTDLGAVEMAPTSGINGVVRVDEEPVAKCYYSLFTHGKHHGKYPWAAGATDAKGRFQITGLPPGTYDLHSSHGRARNVNKITLEPGEVKSVTISELAPPDSEARTTEPNMLIR